MIRSGENPQLVGKRTELENQMAMMMWIKEIDLLKEEEGKMTLLIWRRYGETLIENSERFLVIQTSREETVVGTKGADARRSAVVQ